MNRTKSAFHSREEQARNENHQDGFVDGMFGYVWRHRQGKNRLSSRSPFLFCASEASRTPAVFGEEDVVLRPKQDTSAEELVRKFLANRPNKKELMRARKSFRKYENKILRQVFGWSFLIAIGYILCVFVPSCIFLGFGAALAITIASGTIAAEATKLDKLGPFLERKIPEPSIPWIKGLKSPDFSSEELLSEAPAWGLGIPNLCVFTSVRAYLRGIKEQETPLLYMDLERIKMITKAEQDELCARSCGAISYSKKAECCAGNLPPGGEIVGAL